MQPARLSGAVLSVVHADARTLPGMQSACIVAGEADEARLRELSEELLTGAQPAAEVNQTQASSLQASSGSFLLGWDRRKLFSRSVLSEMWHAKGTHALAAEYRDRIEQLQ